MKANRDAGISEENICEFQEDILIPVQEDRLRAAVQGMARSCADERTVDHVGAALIPSKDEIIRILNILKDVLFPGYFGRQELTHSTLEYHLGNEMMTLFDLLSAQISRSIRHECRRLDSLCVKCMQKGREDALVLMEKLPDLRRLLALDVRAHYDGDPAAKSLDEIVFCYPGLYAIFVYRVAHELFSLKIPLMPRIMTEHAHSLTGIDIHPGARIGTDFFIDHGTGVVIGETTDIGNRVRIYQGVTLGALTIPRGSEGGDYLRGQKRHPTIEDDVTIYAQATILGGGTVIGARCVIGGNVWLTSSVPPDTTVVIETPRLLFKADNQGTVADVAENGTDRAQRTGDA
jgi:serine O-acetyltransferase